MKRRIFILLIIALTTSCAHFEKKAPCDFNNYKTENSSIKEDLTRD